jgi:ubiquitin-activating enzyme E1
MYVGITLRPTYAFQKILISPLFPFCKQADESQERSTGDDETKVTELAEKLKIHSVNSMKINPIKFEKDDDTNFHVDAVYSLANMRARNYGISEVDRLQAKLIAGRIVPAIATSTSLATGLVCLELYKLLLNKPIESYRNTFANLALPLLAMAEPVPPKKTQYNGLEWSLWDRWVIKGDITVRELLKWFRDRGLEAYSVTCGSALLYNSIFPKHKDRMDMKVSELAVSIGKVEIPEKRKHFDVVVACDDDEGEDIDVPLVSIQHKE